MMRTFLNVRRTHGILCAMAHTLVLWVSRFPTRRESWHEDEPPQAARLIPRAAAPLAGVGGWFAKPQKTTLTHLSMTHALFCTPLLRRVVLQLVLRVRSSGTRCVVRSFFNVRRTHGILIAVAYTLVPLVSRFPTRRESWHEDEPPQAARLIPRAAAPLTGVAKVAGGEVCGTSNNYRDSSLHDSQRTKSVLSNSLFLTSIFVQCKSGLQICHVQSIHPRLCDANSLELFVLFFVQWLTRLSCG